MLSSFGSIKSHPPADSSLQSGERHWVDSTVECLTDSSNIDTVGWWIPSLCDWELRAVWWVTVTVSNPSSISGSLLTLAGVAQSHSVHQHPPPRCQAGEFCCGDRAGEEGSGRSTDGLCAWSWISGGWAGANSLSVTFTYSPKEKNRNIDVQIFTHFSIFSKLFNIS